MEELPQILTKIDDPKLNILKNINTGEITITHPNILELFKKYPLFINFITNDRNILIKDSPHLSMAALINPSNNEIKYAIEKDVFSIVDRINDLPEELQNAAVARNSYLLMCLDNASEETQILAIKRSNSNSLTYLFQNPSEKVQMELINKNVYNYFLITNPSDKVKLQVLAKRGSFIKHILNPTREMKITALTDYEGSLRYFESADEEMIDMAWKKYKHSVYNYFERTGDQKCLKFILSDYGLTPEECPDIKEFKDLINSKKSSPEKNLITEEEAIEKLKTKYILVLPNNNDKEFKQEIKQKIMSLLQNKQFWNTN